MPLSASTHNGERQVAARKEAAAKVAANRSAIINDLLKNSGIVRSRTNQYGTTLRVSTGVLPILPINVIHHQQWLMDKERLTQRMPLP